MTSFESNSKNSGSIFGGTFNSRKRRHESARKPSARKFLDQFTLEKMEERWMPVITPTYSSGVLTFSFGAANDSMNLTATAVSGSNNSFSWSGSFGSSGSQANVSSVIFNDAATNLNQSIRFNANASQVVATLSANGIENFNFNGANITSTLSVSNSVSSFTSQTVNSCVSQVSVISANVTFNTNACLTTGTINASASNVTLNSGSFVNTILNQNGGSAELKAGVTLGTFSGTNSALALFNPGTTLTTFSGTNGTTATIATGATVGTATLSNGTGSSTLLVNRGATALSTLVLQSGTVTMYGSVGTINQTGGLITLGYDPVGSGAGASVGSTFSVTNGNVVVSDNTDLNGSVTIGGNSNVSIIKGANGTPDLQGDFIVNNGVVTVGNDVTLASGRYFTVNNGSVALNGVAFDGFVTHNNGDLNITAGTFASGIIQASGILSISGGSLINSPAAGQAPLVISGGTSSVFGATLSPGFADTNAVSLSGSINSVNFGNQTVSGNNTFNITGNSTRYFINNQSPGLTVPAIGNTWSDGSSNYDPATQPWDIQNYLLSVQSYPRGLRDSGPIYFYGTNLYVLNNQQATGINFIQSAIDASLSNGTVNVQGGLNKFDEPNLFTQISLDIVGADTGNGFPVLLPSGDVDKIFAVFDSAIDPITLVSSPTQAFPVSVNLSNFSFDGANLTSANTTKFVGVNYAYYGASSLTLGNNISFSNFGINNSQVLDLQGGLLAVATNNTLSAPIHIAVTAIDGTLTIAANTTVIGSLNSGTPGLDANGTPVAQSTVIAGTLAPLYPTDSVTILGGLVNVTSSGLIDNEAVYVQGGNLVVSGGSITKAVTLSAGNLQVMSGNLSGSLTVDGGVANITGGTFSTTTNELNSIAHTITITQGEVTISGATIEASFANSTYRDGIYLDAPTTTAAYANLTISNSSIQMGATNNNGSAGLRTFGANSTAVGYGNIVLTFGENLSISGGDNSILLSGINTQITGNTFGNITLADPVNNFIKLENYAFYDQVTGIRTLLYGGNVTYVNNSPAYSFQPSGNFDNSNIPTIFNVLSKVTDYSSSSTVGYVYLYDDKNFVLNGQSIQRVVDTVDTNEQIFIQNGTFPESITVPSNKTGTSFFGSSFYAPYSPNQTIVNPLDGSNSAFLIQANLVSILGLTIDGSNGTTALLSNGSLSGVNYGVTNFDGTSFTAIRNLVVQSDSFNNLTVAGVFLKNNNQDSGASRVQNSNFTNIGTTGLVGAIVLGDDFYACVTCNTMSGVTNGLVITDFSVSTGYSSEISNNNISSYATGITLANFTNSASVDSVMLNCLTYGSNMNMTIGSGLTANSIGVYLKDLTGSSLPQVSSLNIDGYAHGIDVTNISQPLTIISGSIQNASVAAVAVLKDQTFDPNTVAPGVGLSSPDVTVSGTSVTAASGAYGFIVEGSASRLLLNCGTSYTETLASPNTANGALVTNSACLTVNDATFISNGTALNAYGIVNDGASLVINEPAVISGFYTGISQSGLLAQTGISGGCISSAFNAVKILSGSLSVTGGNFTSQFAGIDVDNASATVAIDSTTMNTSIHGDSYGVHVDSGTSVSVSQSGSYATSISGLFNAINSSSGDLSIYAGTFTSSSSGNGTISFTSNGILTVSGGSVQSAGLNSTIGILVADGSASISGVTLDGNASEGVRFTSSSGNLSITGNGSVPLISATNIGVNITTGSATINGGQILSSNGIGISFSSSGTLGYNSNVTAATTGLYLTDGFTTITGGTVSSAANGVMFDSVLADGSISGLTFANNVNDLNLTNTTGNVVLGANNVFAASGYYIRNLTTEDFLIDPSSSFSGVVLGSLDSSNATQRSNLFAIEDKIVDKIDNSSFGLIRLKSTDLFVTTSSFYSPNSSADIQRAIDAANGGYTIYVQNGSYTNNLNVNKNLTIQGDSAANTTIVAANSLIPVAIVSASNVSLSCLSWSGYSGSGTGLFVNNTISGLSVSCTTFSNLTQPVEIGSAGDLSNLNLTSVTMNGNTNGLTVDAGGVLTLATLNLLEINNVSGTLFNLAGDVSGLNLSSVNGTNGGTLFLVSGTSSDLSVTTANFSGSINGLYITSSGSLSNGSFTSAWMDNFSGYLGLADGTVNGLTYDGVHATGTSGSILTFNNTTTSLNILNSNFSNGLSNGLTLGSSGSLTNTVVSSVNLDNLDGWVANLTGQVSNLTFNSVSAINAGGSSFEFGNTASQITFSVVTATNPNGNALTFSSTLTDLNISNSDFSSANGSVLSLGGATTNLTVSGTNFSNSTGNTFTLASGQSLTNATLNNVYFDSVGGTFANLQGSVSGLTLMNITASQSVGSALTFGSTSSGVLLSNVTASFAGGKVLTFEGSTSSVSLSGVTATNTNGSVLTFNGTTNSDLNVTNSNFLGTSGDVLTLNGSVTNLTVTGTNFSNATGNGLTLASSKLLTNATFSNDQFNNLGGWGANLAGSVVGLSILDSSFDNLSGTALTLSGASTNVNLSNLSYVTHTDGIVVSSAVLGLTLNNVTLDGSGNGLTVTSTGSINGLTITGSRFSNGTYGLLAVADTSVNTNQNRLTSVSISGSTFAGNNDSGIALGMLNDAVLSNLTVINNGGSTLGSGGILLNLTNGTFGNITLSNVTATDNGLGGNTTSPGFGVKIGTTNGTLTGLTLTSLSISGDGSTAGSVVGLDLFNNVDLGSTSISDLSVSGANAIGLYLTGQSSGQTLNVSNSNLASSLLKYIVTESTGTVVTATSVIFGGVSAGSGLTPEQAYPIVDKIMDSVDESTLGKVVINSGTVYVTPNSFTINTSTPSIQRAITESLSGNTIWIQGNNGSANYTGGVDSSTGGKTLTLNSGNSTSATLVNTEGDWILSGSTTIGVRLGGNTTGTFTQYKLYNESNSMDLSNAVIAYSNMTGYIPTIGDQYNILDQVAASTSATSSTLMANVSGSMTTLTNGGRYQLASDQYFMSIYEGGSNHNDFVLVSAPSQVSNVVVYSAWADPNIYLGDPVYYVNSAGSTIELTYGLTAASNLTAGSAQLEAANATLTVSSGTYAQVLSKGGLVSNQTYNLIGLSNVSGSIIPDAQEIGNVTVSGISLVTSDTINYRVNGGVFGQFDQLNTNGPIVLGNAVANIAISNAFVSPPSLNSWLPLVNNTHPSDAISGQFRFANGTQIDTGMPLSIPNDPTHDLYTTYKFGTQAPYNDFALIWSLAPGTQTQVVVDAAWAGVEFGAVQSFNGANYTIGLDGFAQMAGYSPVVGTSLVGGVAAVSANGTITIADGTYNSTFTVNKGFQLIAPTGANQSALFPLATGQTVLQSGANVASTNWTGNIRFGNLYVGSGTIFDNVASIVDSNGLLTFDSGVTYANVALSATRSITIQSNLAGTPVTFSTATGCTALSASGAGINLTLSDITVSGTGTGMNLTNTGTVSFNNVTLNNTLTTPGTINGPTILNLNYPSSTSSNNLTVTMNNLTFTPFGTNPVSLLTSNNFSLNANIGTTAGSAGNNTISVSSNMITAGSLIQTGNGRDAFNISSPAPVVIKAGAGNDTVSILAVGAYIQSFDGESGIDMFKGGPQSNIFDITGDYAGTLYLTTGCATTSSGFTNTEALIGSSQVDSFYFTNNLARMATVNGGLGNDNLNFNGTSGSNSATSYTNLLEFNINGASSGSVNYFNLGNVTATTSVVDSFVSLENLVGGLADDIVRMQSTVNGSGANVMGTIAGSFNGAAGNNTIDYSSYAAGVSVNLTNKSATGIGSASNLRINNVRDVYGTAFNDVLTGDAGHNILVGNNGNDSLVGNAGNDFLIGSYGTDTLVGGAGWNMNIGGYVDFLAGGNSTSAYGIPSQYVDFVLRNLMSQSNWGGVNDATTFNNAANLCETTGVNFYVPGTATQFTSIRLYSGSGTNGPDGTVFDDSQQNSINPGTSLQQAWLFYTSRDTYDGSKVRRASRIFKSFP